ncbi:MAG TPA: class E sortase [Actinomycetota bacterium]|nr:class E sortase [Actinomycetota bacterium]
MAVILALGGVSLVAYPFATDLWAERIQKGLVTDLASNAMRYRLGEIRTGEALTRLEIPRLDVDVVVVEGTTNAALAAGAGHYPETPLPGEEGNVAIAGHRTTYGKPFSRMDELVEGDLVTLTTPIGKHTYEIMSRPWVVDPFDWSPVDDYPDEAGTSFLTLTSCHPEGSATYRIIVRGRLVKSTGAIAEKASTS